MAKKKMEVGMKAGDFLRPDDKGFEEAARKRGLWVPTGYEKNGIFYEAYQRIAPRNDAFEDLLKRSLDGLLDAIVQIGKD